MMNEIKQEKYKMIQIMATTVCKSNTRLRNREN